MKKFLLALSFVGAACAHRGPASPDSSRPDLGQKITEEGLYVSTAITQTGVFITAIDGAAVDQKGNLYVGNFLEKGMIAIKRPDGDFQAWLKLPDVEIDVNGAPQRKPSVPCSIRIDARNRMFVADFVHHRIYLINPETKEIDVYFQSTDPATRFHQPNDIAIARDGTLYLSDPKWGDASATLGRIWKLSPDRQLTLVREGLRVPNGIALSPDETKLYFTDSASAKWVDGPAAQEFLFEHELAREGAAGTRVLADYQGRHLDGMTVDRAGDLFVTIIGSGLVDQLSPRGELVRHIPLLGTKPTNLTFGGPDGRTLYVTQRDGAFVEAFRTATPGR